MKNIKDKSVDWATSEGLQLFTDLLKEGKILLGPSDTVLGLYGLPSQEAVFELNKLKNRCQKPYILLVKDCHTASTYAEKGQLEAYKLVLEKYWPGPLTVIVRAKQDLPVWISSQQKTIALRVPQHEQLQVILSKIPALFSTSANKSGEPVPLCVSEVDLDILDQVSGIVIDSSAQQKYEPSTIIDISSGQLKLIRQGACDLGE